MTKYQSNFLFAQQPTWIWRSFQQGLSVFPILPSLAALGFVAMIGGVWRRYYTAIILNPLNQGLVILTFLLLISCSFAEQPVRAFLGLGNFLPHFIFFGALSYLMRGTKQLWTVADLLVFPAIPVVFLGFGQMFWGWKTGALWHSLSGWELVSKGNPEGRMASAFMYANILALYLLIVFSLGLGLWVRAYQDCYGVKGIGRLAILTVLEVSIAIALILTHSRNAWGISAIVFLAFALYLGWRWLSVLLISLVGTILWASFLPKWGGEWLRIFIPSYIWARISGDLYPDVPVAEMRSTQWQFCWDLIQARPWLGWGLRHFELLYQNYTGFWLGHPHNLFLMLMAEVGLPTTLLFCGLVGWVMVRALLQLQWYRGSDRLILFTYIVTFSSCIFFNFLDVSIFDLRLNALGWLLFAALAGVTFRKGLMTEH